MFFEDSRWRKFSKFMAHHVFSYKDGIENFPVMHQKCVPNEFRGNHRAARPRLNRLFYARDIHLVDFFEEVSVNERTFF